MKYYSIGVPVGMLGEQSIFYFWTDGQLYNMNPDAYNIWLQFRFGNTQERVLQKKALVSQLGADTVEAVISALLSAKLIVTQESLLQHVPQRQGIGIGGLHEEDDCRISLNGSVAVNYLSYLIWLYCDGRTALKDVIARLPEELSEGLTSQTLLLAVDELIAKKVLIFTD